MARVSLQKAGRSPQSEVTGVRTVGTIQLAVGFRSGLTPVIRVLFRSLDSLLGLDLLLLHLSGHTGSSLQGLQTVHSTVHPVALKQLYGTGIHCLCQSRVNRNLCQYRYAVLLSDLIDMPL